MIWILFAGFSAGQKQMKTMTEVFQRVCAEKTQQAPSATVRIDEIKSKKELFTCVHEIQKQGSEISEWHFVGCGTPYGPLMASHAWPEEMSPHEWNSLKIPFASKAQAWFYMEGSSGWLAPFMASAYGIKGYGCHRLSEAVSSGMQAFSPGFWKDAADYNPIASLYAKTFSDITVRRDECRWLEKKLSQQAPGRVLDIGCGNGALLAHLAPRIKQGVGVDISSAAIKIASQSYKDIPHLSFTAINGPTLPFADGSFNTVISMLSFRYLDWDPILQEMTRVLAPGGRILIVDMVASRVQFHQWPSFTIDKLKNSCQMRKRRDFAKNLNQLVNHPDWKKMISRHPMHWQSEFTWYLKSRFPQGKMTVLNTGLRAKILAFDSGPVK